MCLSLKPLRHVHQWCDIAPSPWQPPHPAAVPHPYDWDASGRRLTSLCAVASTCDGVTWDSRFKQAETVLEKKICVDTISTSQHHNDSIDCLPILLVTSCNCLLSVTWLLDATELIKILIRSNLGRQISDQPINRTSDSNRKVHRDTWVLGPSYTRIPVTWIMNMKH